MRFEIRAGGAFLILLGLAGLSGAVFALGLVAGYEMASENRPDASQISTTFPVPNPGRAEAAASAIETVAPKPASSAALAARPDSSIGPLASAEQPKGAASPVTHVGASSATLARAKPHPALPTTKTAAAPPKIFGSRARTAVSEVSLPPRLVASASAPVAETTAHRRPYSIQIEAVMDRDGADEMVSKLRALGYEAHEVEMAIDSHSWYRVRVGPYETQEQAKEAQERLHDRYKAAYVTRSTARYSGEGD